MRPFFKQSAEFLRHYDPRTLAAVAAGVVVCVLLLAWLRRRRRPSPEELERRRRTHLATIGRLTDGHLTDTGTLHGGTDEAHAHVAESDAHTPEVLFYSYRLAGVTYNCAQDVSALGERIRGLQLDRPIQVRYDVRNPGNSIVVSEGWSGLRVTRGK